MINTLTKYFAGELSAKETELFLSDVGADVDLKKKLIEVQQLIMLTNLLSRKGDEERAQLSFSRFMRMQKENSN